MCVGWKGFWPPGSNPVQYYSIEQGGIIAPVLLPPPGVTSNLPIDLTTDIFTAPVQAGAGSDAIFTVEIFSDSFAGMMLDLEGTYDSTNAGTVLGCDVDGNMGVPSYNIFSQHGLGSGNFSLDDIDLSSAVGSVGIVVVLATDSADSASSVAFTKALLHF